MTNMHNYFIQTEEAAISELGRGNNKKVDE